MPGEQTGDDPDDPTDDEAAAARCVVCGAPVEDDDSAGYELFELCAADGRPLVLLEVCDECVYAGRVPATAGRV